MQTLIDCLIGLNLVVIVFAVLCLGVVRVALLRLEQAVHRIEAASLVTTRNLRMHMRRQDAVAEK